MRPTQIGLDEGRPEKICSAEVRQGKVRLAELCTTEIRSEVRPAKFCPCELCVSEICFTKVSPTEVRTGEICVTEVRAAKIWFDVTILLPSAIPYLGSFQPFKMLRICHRCPLGASPPVTLVTRNLRTSSQCTRYVVCVGR